MTEEKYLEIQTSIDNCPVCRDWDDYLFCSTCEEEIEMLEEALVFEREE